jgi:hypothetical protein
MVTLSAIQGKAGVRKGADQLEKLISRQIIFFLSDKMDKKTTGHSWLEKVQLFCSEGWVDTDIEHMSPSPFLLSRVVYELIDFEILYRNFFLKYKMQNISITCPVPVYIMIIVPLYQSFWLNTAVPRVR